MQSHVDPLEDRADIPKAETPLRVGPTITRTVLKAEEEVEGMVVVHIHLKDVAHRMVRVTCLVAVPGEEGLVGMELVLRITLKAVHMEVPVLAVARV